MYHCYSILIETLILYYIKKRPNDKNSAPFPLNIKNLGTKQ